MRAGAIPQVAAIVLASLASPTATAQSDAVHPLTSVDEVVDAVEACLAATNSMYVNLDTLSGSGWKITEVNGDPSAMAINNYNKRGSNADILIISVARNPGSLQCSAIGRFPGEGPFADLDKALEGLFTRPPDRLGTDTQDTGDKTALSFWNLEHKSVQVAHFFDRNSVMITVRYV